MKKNSIFSIVLLTAGWIVLREDFSVVTIATGFVVSAGCVWLCRKYLPLERIEGVNFLKLAGYPFYVAGQVYLSGIAAIRIILTRARVDIVEIKTTINNEFLRVVLANSITLIPGSVSLELKDDTITVLCLRRETDSEPDAEEISKRLKGRLEEKLLKAQR